VTWRRGIGRIALIALWLWLGCGRDPAGEKPTFLPDGTSVVFLTIDTLRHDHLSRNGHARETTPYLDRLADEAVYSSHCYAQSSWTLPSMLSMFSSLEPAVFGVTRGVAPIAKPNGKKKRGLAREEVLLEYFSDHYTTLPEVLAENGYATAGFSTNGHLRTEQGFAQGFEIFDQESCMWGTAACVFERAVAWLDGYVERKRDRPFFLWVHLFDPHFDERRDGDLESPRYAPARGYADLFAGDAGLPLEERTRVAYDRKLRYTDDRIAAFVEELRGRGILDRVVLIVAADHGEEFNEKGRWGHSKSLFNSLVRVPLIFRFPAGTPRGVVEVPVRNLDIAPTLLDALGLPPQPAMRGTSLLQAFRGEPFRAPPGYGETRRFGLDLRFLIDPARNRKLLLDMESGKRELYDFSADPDELSDLTAAEPETADALERALRAAIRDMESRAAPSSRVESLSAVEIQHLRELGYID
jgi:arylsulfatase A-like enzyme